MQDVAAPALLPVVRKLRAVVGSRVSGKDGEKRHSNLYHLSRRQASVSGIMETDHSV